MKTRGPFETLRWLLGDMAQSVDALDATARHLEKSTQKQQRMIEEMRRAAQTRSRTGKPIHGGG